MKTWRWWLVIGGVFYGIKGTSLGWFLVLVGIALLSVEEYT